MDLLVTENLFVNMKKFEVFELKYTKVNNEYGKYRLDLIIDGTLYSPGFGKTKKEALNHCLFQIFHLLKDLVDEKLIKGKK